MKTLASAFALIACLSAPASAADIYSTKDPVESAINALNSAGWTGFYVSAGVGGAFTDSTAKFGGSSVDLALTGAYFDGRIGYDRSFAPWLVGVYGEVGHAKDVNGQVAGTTLATNWTYGGGIRAGREFGTALVYGLAGYSHQDVSFSGPTKGLDGIKAGAGIEIKLDPHWFAALEGSVVWYEDAANITSLGLSNITFSDRQEMIELRLGYKL